MLKTLVSALGLLLFFGSVAQADCCDEAMPCCEEAMPCCEEAAPCCDE